MIDIRKRFALRLDEKNIFDDVYFRDEYNIKELVGHSVEYVVDVGAHIGSFTAAVMDFLNPVRVIAIEPHPKNYQLLRCNVNNMERPERVWVSNTAVHDGSYEEVRLTDKIDINTGGSTVRGIQRLEPGREDNDKSFMVPASYLPDLLRGADFPRIDLLKLDCEGGEIPALMSLRDTGWLRRTKWIRGEFHSCSREVQDLLHETHAVSVHSVVGSVGKFVAHRT